MRFAPSLSILLSLAVTIIGVSAPTRAVLADQVAEGAARTIPCTCRFDGADYDIGERACIRGKAATCSRVLNNTSWSISDAPCPLFSLLRAPETHGLKMTPAPALRPALRS